MSEFGSPKKVQKYGNPLCLKVIPDKHLFIGTDVILHNKLAPGTALCPVVGIVQSGFKPAARCARSSDSTTHMSSEKPSTGSTTNLRSVIPGTDSDTGSPPDVRDDVAHRVRPPPVAPPPKTHTALPQSPKVKNGIRSPTLRRSG